MIIHYSHIEMFLLSVRDHCKFVLIFRVYQSLVEEECTVHS